MTRLLISGIAEVADTRSEPAKAITLYKNSLVKIQFTHASLKANLTKTYIFDEISYHSNKWFKRGCWTWFRNELTQLYVLSWYEGYLKVPSSANKKNVHVLAFGKYSKITFSRPDSYWLIKDLQGAFELNSAASFAEISSNEWNYLGFICSNIELLIPH